MRTSEGKRTVGKWMERSEREKGGDGIHLRI